MRMLQVSRCICYRSLGTYATGQSVRMLQVARCICYRSAGAYATGHAVRMLQVRPCQPRVLRAATVWRARGRRSARGYTTATSPAGPTSPTASRACPATGAMPQVRDTTTDTYLSHARLYLNRARRNIRLSLVVYRFRRTAS